MCSSQPQMDQFQLMAQAEVQFYRGKPAIFFNGEPNALPMYSPSHGGPWVWAEFEKQAPRFFSHKIGAYFLHLPGGVNSDFDASPFWQAGDVIREPESWPENSLDAQAELILNGDPDAYLIVRFPVHEPVRWREAYPDELFVSEDGEVLAIPSLASSLFWETSAAASAAIIEYCESRPWAGRIIGYANFHRMEGCHEPPVMKSLLFDHGPRMQERWREYLQAKYSSIEELRKSYSNPEITFDNAPVPGDKLRGSVPEVSALLYWQNAKDNAPLRDYLLLSRDLFHQGFKAIAAAMHGATERLNRKRFFVHDALKQTMLGWSVNGFFDDTLSWPLVYPETVSASGSMNAAELFSAPGVDGLATPHDYQVRGVGGVFEQEGIVDSAVLRGKLFFSEMDIRSFTDNRDPHYGQARDLEEFNAITWRNIATAITRGFHPYYMDLYSDWLAHPEMHKTIARQVGVLRQAVHWPHETVPGIAMILDDTAVLETNGSGHVMNEAILWEQKMGLARCGVPYRIYLFDDLALDNFPEHRVFYFPNLYRVDEVRLKLLQDRVLCNGNVILWGPGTGISDGEIIGTEMASRLTGFEFESLPVNYPRRTLITDFTDPITKDLRADTVIGGPLSYGPLLFPLDGKSLGVAWTKQGRRHSGLSVKEFGNGAWSTLAPERGTGDWVSVFAHSVPLPADLWRGLARFAGTHVYCETNDVLVANNSVVGIHSAGGGEKEIMLPARSDVLDLVSGEVIAKDVDRIAFTMAAPETRVFQLKPHKSPQ